MLYIVIFSNTITEHENIDPLLRYFRGIALWVIFNVSTMDEDFGVLIRYNNIQFQKWTHYCPLKFICQFSIFFQHSGLTAENYAQLGVLYKRYAKQGFQVLVFPSNQFNQEPLTNPLIKAWNKKNEGEYGAVQKWRHRGEEGGRLDKLVTNGGKGGRGYWQVVTSP